jgi:hypothetical protein
MNQKNQQNVNKNVIHQKEKWIQCRADHETQGKELEGEKNQDSLRRRMTISPSE